MPSFRPRFARSLLAALLVTPVIAVTTGTAPVLAQTPPATTPAQEMAGYVMTGADAAAYTFGNAPFFGSGTAIRPARPVVDLALAPDQAGYWQVASDGGVFAHGSARFLGSTGAMRLNQPVVGMATTPTGQGYWLVAADGGIFSFGDARFLGSTGAIRLNRPVVGMARTPSNGGYWLVASDGGVFSFGDARFLGSTGAIRLAQPIVDLAAAPLGDGYVLAAADGGVFAFGTARFAGSLGGRRLGAPIVGIEVAAALPPDFALTVLHNNDAESKVREGDDGFGGAARFATLLRQLRTAAVDDPGTGLPRGVVTISSGDNFLAGPELNASLELPEGQRFYDALLLDLLDYDAVTIGNHEFDFGPALLARFIRDAGPTPFLSANLDVSAEPSLRALVEAGRIVPSTVVEKDGRRIGIVGLLTPELPLISSPGGARVREDLAGIVQAQVDALAARGVTRIILSSHLQGIEEEIELVQRLQGVDVVIAGGGDELLADAGTRLVGDPDPRPRAFSGYPFVGTDATGGPVPIVTTPGDYNYVGRLQVTFDAAGNLLRILGGGLHRVSAVAPDAVAPAADVQAQVVDPVEASIAALAANVVARSEVPLDGRNPDPIRLRESNLGNLVADAMLFAGQQRAAGARVAVPRVSLQNGGGIRNNSVIPAGPLTELDTFSILPFSNIVTVVQDLSPAELKELLEHSVSALPSANGLFGHWGGLTFEYDAGRTAQVVSATTNRVTTPGARIRNAWLREADGSRGAQLVRDGVALPGPSVALATVDFTGRGGDNYPFAGKGAVNNLGVSYQQALVDYLTSTAGPVAGGTLDGLRGTISAAEYPAVPDRAAATRIRPV